MCLIPDGVSRSAAHRLPAFSDGSDWPDREVAEQETVRENGVMDEVGGRPPRERLVCVDCGLDLDPAEALEIRLTNRVMKVCPACQGAVRGELGGRP
jgi:hypothetical protein